MIQTATEMPNNSQRGIVPAGISVLREATQRRITIRIGWSGPPRHWLLIGKRKTDAAPTTGSHVLMMYIYSPYGMDLWPRRFNCCLPRWFLLAQCSRVIRLALSSHSSSCLRPITSAVAMYLRACCGGLPKVLSIFLLTRTEISSTEKPNSQPASS